jgi:drug/metabolite transporter (DMT)-like permease
MKAGRTFVTIIAVLAAFFWGMSFVWTKVVFQYYSPLTTIFIRLLFSSALLIGIWAFFVKNDPIKRSDIKLILLSAFFTPFCYFLGESYGLAEVSSTIASVIIATIPVFTPFVAFFMLKERLTVMNFAGMLVSFAGVLVMLLNKDFSLNASGKGLILLSFAVLAALGSGITVRKLSLKYNPITIVGFQNLVGAIYFLPFFLYFDWDSFLQVKPDRQLLTSMLSLIIFASSLAFICYTYAVRHLGIGRTNIFSNLIPVFTAIFSLIILHEQITLAKTAGMMMVILGVIIAQWNKHKQKQSAPADEIIKNI